MTLDWNEHKEDIWSCIKQAGRTNDEHYARIKNNLISQGYDEQDVDAVLTCERRAMEAMKNLFYPYALEFLGGITPEEAQEQAQPYLDEYNHSAEVGSQIAEGVVGCSEPPAEGQEPRMG